MMKLLRHQDLKSLNFVARFFLSQTCGKTFKIDLKLIEK